MPKFKCAADVSWKINGRNIVILNLKTGNYYFTNDTGIVFLEHCDGKHDFNQIVALICRKYRVAPSAIVRDLMKFAEKLLREKLLRRCR